jgi:hypothetical protein
MTTGGSGQKGLQRSANHEPKVNFYSLTLAAGEGRRPETGAKSTVNFGSGAVERSPTLGRINGLQKVRVEMGPLSKKGDFCPTRTCLAPSPYGTE